ncbi:hypothetical protein ACTXT7_016945 [Hymenolepis weldensis]
MGNVFKGIPARHSVTNYGCISSNRECPTCRGSGVIEDVKFSPLSKKLLDLTDRFWYVYIIPPSI